MNEDNDNNYNKKNKDDEIDSVGLDNPFIRKSGIMRSPPTNVASKPAVNSRIPQGNSVERLGAKISELVAFLKTKSNIHRDIVIMTNQIQAIFLQMSAELNSAPVTCPKPVLLSSETQTEKVRNPQQPQFVTPKRKRENTTLSPKGGIPKKKKNGTPKKVKETGKKVIETPTDTTSSDGKTTDTNSGKVVEAKKSSEWIRVRGKAKNRRKTARPDALVIQTCGEKSYADILKKVKSDPKLDILGQSVRTIRKTAKGELLLELSKPAHRNTGEFRQTMEEVLGTAAEVRALTHEIALEIKDIDEVTTSDEVYTALVNVSDDFKSLQKSTIKSIRKAYGGTQTAVIGLSAGLANRLLEISKIRIGWVMCRIREKLTPRRCYKCMEFGHNSSKCRSQNNHSDKCLQCGEAGHKIKTCKNNPSCLLCRSTALNRKSDHVTGCVVCPYYKKAIQNLRLRK